MSWTYRIVKKGNNYGLYPVFIDENQDAVNISNIPVCLSDTILGLLEVENKAGLPISSFMKEAWDHPVMNYNTGEDI